MRDVLKRAMTCFWKQDGNATIETALLLALAAAACVVGAKAIGALGNAPFERAAGSLVARPKASEPRSSRPELPQSESGDSASSLFPALVGLGVAILVLTASSYVLKAAHAARRQHRRARQQVLVQPPRCRQGEPNGPWF